MMEDEFIPFLKNTEKSIYIVISLRMEEKLKNQYDEAAKKNGCSRNALMAMALRYGLQHIKVLD